MLRISTLPPYLLAHSPTRLRLTLVAGAVLVCGVYVGPVHAADAVKSSEKPPSTKLAVDPREVQRPWTGDLDGIHWRNASHTVRSASWGASVSRGRSANTMVVRRGGA